MISYGFLWFFLWLQTQLSPHTRRVVRREIFELSDFIDSLSQNRSYQRKKMSQISLVSPFLSLSIEFHRKFNHFVVPPYLTKQFIFLTSWQELILTNLIRECNEEHKDEANILFIPRNSSRTEHRHVRRRCVGSRLVVLIEQHAIFQFFRFSCVPSRSILPLVDQDNLLENEGRLLDKQGLVPTVNLMDYYYSSIVKILQIFCLSSGRCSCDLLNT